MHSLKSMANSFIFCLLIINLGATALAQNYLMHPVPEDKARMGIKYMRPNGVGDFLDLTGFSATYDFYVNIPVSSVTGLLVSIPYTRFNDPHMKIRDYSGQIIEVGVSSSNVGNIYCGVQVRMDSLSSYQQTLTVGAHLPTAQERKDYSYALFDLLCDPYNPQRMTTWVWGFDMNFAIRRDFYNAEGMGAYWGTELNPLLLIPRGGGESELIMRYGISAGSSLGKFAFGFEFLGAFIVTEDIKEFPERFDHYAVFGISLINSPVRPAIFYQLPVDDDLNELINGIFGLKLEGAFPIKRR